MNDQFLANLLSIAVWGSLSASILTGTFCIVQAFCDETRRMRYVPLGVLCLGIAFADYSYPLMHHLTYEKVRIALWTAYATLMLALFGHPLRWIAATAIALPCIGAAVWNLVDPRAATSGVVPAAFLIRYSANGAVMRRVFSRPCPVV
jgi:hypothetical protein